MHRCISAAPLVLAALLSPTSVFTLAPATSIMLTTDSTPTPNRLLLEVFIVKYIDIIHSLNLDIVSIIVIEVVVQLISQSIPIVGNSQGVARYNCKLLLLFHVSSEALHHLSRWQYQGLRCVCECKCECACSTDMQIGGRYSILL